MASALDTHMTGVASLDAAAASASRGASSTSSQLAIDDLDDRSLVACIRRGERAAEAELYARYARPIAETVVYLLRSRTEAQDILQDTFVDAFAQIGRLRNEASVRAWLFGIAIHKVQRRFRRRKLLMALGLERGAQDEREDSVASSPSGDCPPEVRAELALLDRALASLTTEQRVAWMLRRVEGYTLGEIAEACRCSLATAKRRLVAADQTVRMHVQDEGLPSEQDDDDDDDDGERCDR